MTDLEFVAGLETHVQLRTATKLFCGCTTTFAPTAPNTQTCPVCLGLPGALPVLNKSAVELAVRVGLALNASVAPVTRFDRKNYFYPDLPKNYQISQFDVPICSGGWLDVEGRRVGLVRAHLEEDAGKLLHDADGSRVDLNRAGVPLVEIVTRPDLRSSAEAYAYLESLKKILQYIDASGCDMEKGELRVDVNLSVRPRGATTLGTKVEVKNLNSFRNVQRALDFEFERQSKVLRDGGRIVQETRLFDAERGITESMRSKEEAHDYRYFPEPDLPPLPLDAGWIDGIRRALPELPAARRDRFVREHGLSDYDARILTADRASADLFEEATRLSGRPKVVANWIVNDVNKVLNEHKLSMRDSKSGAPALAELLALLDAGTITAATAKEVLQETVLSGRPPGEIVRERGLGAVTDIDALVERVLAASPKAVADFRSGKESAMKWLVGQVMKETKGRARAPEAEALLRRKLS